jgi:KipI family sensor histidine kinase inhibitor
MIHAEPVFRPLADCYLGVEFGDEADLALSFRVLSLLEVLAARAVPGVVELQPTMRQLGIVLDRSVVTHAELQRAVEDALPEADAFESLPSRLVVMPCWYDDPWSAELARQYGVPNNIEFVAEHNGLTVPELVAAHTRTDWWVALVGFMPGCNLHYPLDTTNAFSAPKYQSPRTYTPARTIAVAGAGTAQYPVASPGGYQCLGRLAVDIYQPTPRNPAFPPDGVLLRAGDRIRYRPVNAIEYEEIREQLEAGTYEYEIAEGAFDFREYLAARPSRDAALGVS